MAHEVILEVRSASAITLTTQGPSGTMHGKVIADSTMPITGTLTVESSHLPVIKNGAKPGQYTITFE